MSKSKKNLVFALALLFLGIGIVSAARQTIKTETGYNLTGGRARSFVNLSSRNDTAYAMVDPTIISDGVAPKLTKFIGYKSSGGTLTNKKTGTGSLYSNACTDITIGNIGSGTWTITNQAFDGNVIYTGWSGTLTLYSL